MAKQFRELRERLLRAGVAPRHVTRYLRELADHFADLRAEEERAGRTCEDAESAAMTRLGGLDDLVRAITQQRHFQSWCVRAPWAAFGLVPLLILAGVWFAASVVSLSGFNTPLTSPDKFPSAMKEARIGISLFFVAPILIGWGIGLIAVRQRFRAVWPSLSLLAITLVSSTLRISFTGFAFSTIGGGSRFGGIVVAALPEALLSALLTLLLTALPYWVWRLRVYRSERGSETSGRS